MLILRNGRVAELVHNTEVFNTLPDDCKVIDHTEKLIIPGFIDAHIHFVQVDVIASFGKRLLEWLEKYTFPAERQFEDPAHAALISEFFLDELLCNGTTTALVLGSVHKQSANGRER
ncbi:amidohydrolase family protein [Rhodobacteraceae bacterium Araon29]